MTDDIRQKYLVEVPKNSELSVKPDELGFASTEEIEPSTGLKQIIGQERPLALLLKTLRNERPPSNAMTFGDPGIGKTFSITRAIDRVNFYVNREQEESGFIESRRAEESRNRDHPFEPTLEELVMDVADTVDNAKLVDQMALYNFQKPPEPKSLVLSAGLGEDLELDLLGLVRDLKDSGSAALAKLAEANKIAQDELDFGKYTFRIEPIMVQSMMGGAQWSGQSKAVVFKGLPKEEVAEVQKRIKEGDTLLSELYTKLEEVDLQYLTSGGSSTSSVQLTDDGNAVASGSGITTAESLRETRQKEHDRIFKEYQTKVRDLSFNDNYFALRRNDSGGQYYLLHPEVTPQPVSEAQEMQMLMQGDAGDAVRFKYRFHRLQQLDNTLLSEVAQIMAKSSSDSGNQGRIDDLIDELKVKWEEKLVNDPEAQEKLLEWFGEAREDLRHNIQEYLAGEQRGIRNKPTFDKFLGNLLVNNANTEGVPVAVVQAPSVSNLFGRTEHDSLNNTPEHMRLTAGAVMQANGGFLVIDEGIVVLTNESALNYMLTIQQENEIRVGQVGGTSERGGGTSGHIQSEPFLAATKWVMNVNENGRQIMEKVPQIARRNRVVDFDGEMADTLENRVNYGLLVANEIKRYNNKKKTGPETNLPQFDATGVAYLVQIGKSMARHKSKITNNLDAIAQIAIQSAQIARDAGDGLVSAEHIKYHLDQLRRGLMVEEQELVDRIVEQGISPPVGWKVGKINNAYVIQLPTGNLGGYFRVEATIERGKGEPQLVGKGLAGDTTHFGFEVGKTYLANTFGYAVPETTRLRASVGFPTTPGKIDGNSASAAGLLAIVSSLTRNPEERLHDALEDATPLYQGIIFTGAAGGNEGEISWIGAPYDKIRGAFDAFIGWGLIDVDTEGNATGVNVERYRELVREYYVLDEAEENQLEQMTAEDVVLGSAIPSSNLRETQEGLALDDQLADAIRSGFFNLYSYKSIDEAIEIATNRPVDDVLESASANLPRYLLTEPTESKKGRFGRKK